MKKFKFHLQTVLKFRQRAEDVARSEYLDAKTDLDRCLGEIQEMYKKNDETRVLIQKSQVSGTEGEVFNLQNMNSFILGLKIRIQSRREDARELMSVVEEKQMALVECAKDRKSMESLKEKLKSRHREIAKRLEEMEFDDLNLMRFKKQEQDNEL